MKNAMRILALVCAGILMMVLASCDAGNGGTTDTTATQADGKPVMVEGDHSGAYADKAFGFQLEAPAVGEEIAIMHTSMGDISLRFFPEAAPNAVANFKALAQSGYYNGVTFHRVMNDFMIQGGDPTATGSGGESIWGQSFADEFCPKLGNLRGSLAMANAGENTNGSQFFINQNTSLATMFSKYIELWENNKDKMPSYKSLAEFFGAQAASQYGLVADKITEDVIKAYAEVGGSIHLDGPLRESGGHTVFGQVVSGMDVVDAIAAVETGNANKPIEDVTIKSIEWTTYQG
ncbi:MAG: peptidylprolyl isomerase [Clostridia bacterium]|nr:peptidylprolyl isomerase [Clostridia bacterium]